MVLHSQDDPWAPFSHGEMIAQDLQARFLTFDHYGHFGKLHLQVPEILAEALRP